MRDPIECVGCPRDQGLDQGHALEGAVRDAVVRAGLPQPRRRLPALAALARGPVLGRGAGRDFLRHHTQLAERTEGIALAAGLSLAALVEMLLSENNALCTSAAALASPGQTAVLSRSLPEASAESSRWILRRSRPDVGFASVEVTLPFLAVCAAGVNEAGLAAALVPGAGSAGPAALLQECLQHFEDCDACLDWCSKRPSVGRGSAVFADASGEVAAIHVEGEGRRVQRSSDGGIVLGVGAAQEVELRKQLQKNGRLEIAVLGSAIWLDPSERCLSLEDGTRVPVSTRS